LHTIQQYSIHPKNTATQTSKKVHHNVFLPIHDDFDGIMCGYPSTSEWTMY